jgi:hypothetical protein
MPKICQLYDVKRLDMGHAAQDPGMPHTPQEVGLKGKNQVEEVASSGILVGSHGAGMTNLMFLPPNGAVIELFPYKWWPDMYRRMVRHPAIAFLLQFVYLFLPHQANEMGVPYYMAATYDPPPVFPDDSCFTETAKSFVCTFTPILTLVVVLTANRCSRKSS